ncbi:MAG TPA: ABC transporter ATP-binding protein [Planctomycetaceae bacterium]|jgi:ABC-2 type transport system ATP-binding protein
MMTKNFEPHSVVEFRKTTATIPIRRSLDTASLLEVSHLRKSFGSRVAVDDLSFRVEAGEIFGLVGPNGAGKSTTMMIVAGVRRADSGAVTIAGETAGYGNKAVQMTLGVVPQDLAIYGDLTARENLDFFGQIYGVYGSELERRIARVLAQVGLESHAHQYVRTFSGGMKRRLNFGVALIHEPRVVILDEPTVGIDPQSRSHILDCVRELAASGVGVIYASHYMEEIEAICQKVAIIDRGRMLVQGALDELIDTSGADLFLRVAVSQSDLERRLLGLADVVALGRDESRVVIKRDGQALPDVVARRLTKVVDLLTAAGFEILSIETQKQSLERLFLELTGRKLRD